MSDLVPTVGERYGTPWHNSHGPVVVEVVSEPYQLPAPWHPRVVRVRYVGEHDEEACRYWSYADHVFVARVDQLQPLKLAN